VSSRVTWSVLALLAVAYVGLAAWIPPLDDELYYWCWAQKPQLSYFDHGPLSGWFVAASTFVFGDSVLAIRVPAVLTSLVVVAILGKLMRPPTLWPWVILTPLFTFGAVLITPDTPLLLFWSLYLVWLIEAHKQLTPSPGVVGRISPAMWLLGGVLLGCGALGKYTMALTVPGSFVSFLVAAPRQWWRWLPGYVGHGLVSLLVFTPVIVFNVRHDFAPILFQWGHATSGDSVWWKTAPEFLGIQVLLFGLLPIALFPWVVANWRTLAADPRLRVCAALYAVPFAVFVLKSFRGPLEGNWALAAYLGFWPVAAYWHGTACPPRFRTAARMVGLGVPFCVVIVTAAHLIHPLGIVPVKTDRVSRQDPRLEAAKLGAELAREKYPELPVFTPTYQMTALLRYYGADARQMDGVTRPSVFTMPPESYRNHAEFLVWNEEPLHTEMARGVGPPEVLGRFPVVVRGEEVSQYVLVRYRLDPAVKP
jgi:4-amino-4-deoxy-L-arabinose transferase-like glycosyltransferase